MVVSVDRGCVVVSAAVSLVDFAKTSLRALFSSLMSNDLIS